MGFGGALLAGVRHILNPRGNGTTEQAPRRRPATVRSVIMRWDPMDVFAAVEGLEEDIDDAFEPGGVRLELEREFERRKQRAAEADYKPEYTHPSVPQPGFTHHFSTNPTTAFTDSLIDLANSPSSSSASSSRSSEAALACAQCHDPLFLGASDVGEGRDQRRLWGLHCGHLLDGKCVRKLMQPVSTSGDEQLPNSCVDAEGTLRMEDVPSSNQPNTMAESGADISPIRSRLRSHRGISTTASGNQHSLSQGEPSTPPGTGTPRRTRPQVQLVRGCLAEARNRRGRGKGKGKAKATAPAITAEHQWTCPVNGCGRVHVSVLLDGRWVMDEGRGAIAVFV